MVIEVWDGEKFVGTIQRFPVQRAGYEAVRYHDRYYQLFGGIRTNFRIQLRLPCGIA